MTDILAMLQVDPVERETTSRNRLTMCYSDANAGDRSIGMVSFGKPFGFVYPHHFSVMTSPAMHPSMFADVGVGICKSVAVLTKISHFTGLLKPAFGQNLTQAESLIAPVSDDRASDANLFRQISRPVSYSIDCNHHSISTVSLLLRARGPSDIFRGVIPVVINAVQGVFRTRLRTNVGNKVFVGHCPSITDLDTPSSVVRPCPIIRGTAPILHILPRAIKRLGLFEWHSVASHSGKAPLMSHNATFCKGNEVA